MPKKPRQFVKGEFYHLVLRRLQDEPLFIDTDDHYRGIFSLYEFNDLRPVRIRERRAARARFKKILRQIEEKEIPVMLDKRDLLVEILIFCLIFNKLFSSKFSNLSKG